MMLLDESVSIKVLEGVDGTEPCQNVGRKSLGSLLEQTAWYVDS